MKRMIVIGCGIHYREKYHSVLEKMGVEIVLAIDLADSELLVQQFFNNQRIQPRQSLFIPSQYRNTVSVELIDHLTIGLDLTDVDAVLISTEPKVRKSYALWAIQRGYRLFMDKPVTAFADLALLNLESDFEQILESAKKVNINAVVSCERRAHLGYQWLRQYLKKFIDETGQPITGIDIHFGGGVCKTPYEYLSDENHPFRYGYGVLLHSGYHYVDLLAQLLELNNPKFPTDHRVLNVLASKQSPEFGEVDLLMIGQTFFQGSPVTNFGLKLFGTSVSMRRQFDLKVKLEGRIKQEQVIIHLGHLASIHIRSLPLAKISPSEHPIEDFSITIMNSPLVKNRPPIIQLKREDFSTPSKRRMNSVARQWQLEEFIMGRDGNSPLESHRKTVQLLNEIYSLIISQYHKVS